MKKNEGFTLIELIISLFLVSLFLLLLLNTVKLTSVISKKFLSNTKYEYAMMHKKIFELYNESQIVYKDRNFIYLKNNDTDIEHKLIFRNKKIYKSTKNKGKDIAKGYSLLLENIKNIELSTFNRDDNKIIVINLTDRENNNKTLYIREKNELEDKKNEEEHIEN